MAPLQPIRCLALAASLLVPALASGEPILLWGAARGCQQDEALTQAMRAQMQSAAYPVTPLAGAQAGLSPQDAAAQLRRACPALHGRLLGAVVEPASGREMERYRLWVHDLQTGQTAYLDDWCVNCNLGERMGRRAGFLLKKPRFEAAPTMPTYCQPEVLAPAIVPRSAKVIVVLYGDSKPRAAIWAAVKRDLHGAGRDAVQWHGEAQSFYADTDLKRMVQGDPQGQVLGVEVTDKGASMWVFDNIASQVFPAQINCQDCSKEDLADKVAGRSASLLDEAAKPEPADGASASAAKPPAEACTPLEIPLCGSTRASVGSAASGGIDPKLAKIVKGSLWGLFAASAASSIGLFVANATSAGQIPGSTEHAQDALVRPAYATTAAAVVSLGLAIPITVLINRAQFPARDSGNSPQSSTNLAIQCPN